MGYRLHQQPAYRDLYQVNGSALEAESQAQKVMSLPMSADMIGAVVNMAVPTL